MIIFYSQIHICFFFALNPYFFYFRPFFTENESFGFNQYFLLCVKIVDAQQHNNQFLTLFFIYLILCCVGEEGGGDKYIKYELENPALNVTLLRDPYVNFHVFTTQNNKKNFNWNKLIIEFNFPGKCKRKMEKS